MARGATARDRAPLTRQRIVETAVRLADDEGIADLSMRRLAKQLGFEVMSLYNHVAGKDELLVAMVDHVAGQIAGPPPGATPLGCVRSMSVSAHDVLVAHPWAADQWMRHLPGQHRIQHMEDLLASFAASGLPADLAHVGFHAVTNHVLGYTLQQQGLASSAGDLQARAEEFASSLDATRHPFMRAHVQEHLDGDTAPSFEMVLDLILDGLVRLGRARRRAGRTN
jgi:AcrR family transcriptional regulator